MCGICGKYSLAGVQQAEIESMLSAIAHRGPDDEGLYVEGRVGIGTRRLSIIDLDGVASPLAMKKAQFGSSVTERSITTAACVRNSWIGGTSLRRRQTSR